MNSYKEWLRDNEELIFWLDEHVNFKIEVPKIIFNNNEDNGDITFEAEDKLNKIIEDTLEHRFAILSEYDGFGYGVGVYLSNRTKNDVMKEPIFSFYIDNKGKPEDIMFRACIKREKLPTYSYNHGLDRLEEAYDYYEEFEYYTFEKIKNDLKTLDL